MFSRPTVLHWLDRSTLHRTVLLLRATRKSRSGPDALPAWRASGLRIGASEARDNTMPQFVSASSSAFLVLLAFVVSLVLSGVGSLALSDSLGKVGVRLHFPEPLLGIVTALGANTPEVSSAITTLASGQRDLGLGVILGSKSFQPGRATRIQRRPPWRYPRPRANPPIECRLGAVGHVMRRGARLWGH